MPLIQRYACDRCDFALPTGWGGYAYATDDAGRRVVCPHPEEDAKVLEVTGMAWAAAYEAGRVGHNSHCVCLACVRQFDLDPRRDPVACPACSSAAVRSALDSVGRECPKCKAGVVREGSPIRWTLDPDRAALPVPQVVKDLVAYERDREPPPPGLRAAYDAVYRGAAEGRYGDPATYRHRRPPEYHRPFATLANWLLGWWEGDYFGRASGGGTEPNPSLEMNPRWTWCKVLPDVLRLTPDLDRLVTVRDGGVWFRDDVSDDVRRGIKNYIREHRVHVVMS
ncbi:MAG TPA: hypothetical protein VF796_22340 [Humisphaera sp.]